ncbi:hypothetical protein BZG21_30840, partial [Escherichia coli]|nr:hypothetical protein [Escherichia coli]
MVVPGKQKSRFYLWAVRMLVLTLVFGQFGVYGGEVAQAAAVGGETIVSASKDYRYVMTKDGGKLQVNQKDIDLSWVRSYSVSATGYSFTRRQSVLGNVDYITKVQFGSYSSKYAGQIDHAFFVDFSRIYETYSEMTYRQSGMNVGQWTIIHDDVLGLPTPTYVYDYQANPLTLVVNADTGEGVDFNSELNPYYKN